jgi:hypothetical protein
VRAKKKVQHWIFRLQSNRGTDIIRCVQLRADLTDKEVREVLEDWGDRETRGTACHEYWVNAEKVRVPNRTDLKERFKRLAAAHTKAKLAADRCRAMLIPVDYTTTY